MGGVFRVMGWVLAGLGCLVLAVVLFFTLAFDWNALSGYASHTASEKSGRKVALAEKNAIAVQWGWPVTVITLRGLSVENTEWAKAPKMAELSAAEIQIDMKKLLRLRLSFPQIVLDTPKMALEKRADGANNWDFTQNPSGKAVAAAAPDERNEMPEIGRVLIKDGTFGYRDEKAKTDLVMRVRNFSGSAKETQDLVAEGNGKFGGAPFTLQVHGGDLIALKENKAPYPMRIDTVIGNTKIQANGTVDDPFQLEGLNLRLMIEGKNAADLFPITGIALPPTPPYHIAGRLGYDKGKGHWLFQDFTGRMGDSDLSGDLRWDTGPEEARRKRPMLTAKFLSRKLDFKDLAGFVGAAPKPGAGQTRSEKDQKLATEQAASPYVLPDVPLDISRLAAMDADVTYTANRIISPSLPLDAFFLHVLLEDRMLNLTPVRFGTANGDISATIRVNGREANPSASVDGTFRKLSLARLFAPASEKLGTPNVNKGNIGGVIKLDGHGKSLREILSSSDGTLGLGMEGGQLSSLLVELTGLDVGQALSFLGKGDKPVAVRCMVGDFGVKAGQVQARTLVIDTADTQIAGEGGLNFNTEAMDFTFRAHPKDTSFGSARTPLHVRGTLKKPEISLDTASLLARAGGAVVLALATPVASLLAFIEPGLGDDSPCAQMLRSVKRDNSMNAQEEKLVPKNPTPTPAKP